MNQFGTFSFPFLYGGSELAKHFRHTLRCSATPPPLQLSLSPPPPPLPVAAAAAVFVPLVVIATLLLLFAINRLLCDLLLVSSRCVVCVYAWLRAWIILGFLGLWNRIWCMSVGFSLY